MHICILHSNRGRQARDAAKGLTDGLERDKYAQVFTNSKIKEGDIPGEEQIRNKIERCNIIIIIINRMLLQDLTTGGNFISDQIKWALDRLETEKQNQSPKRLKFIILPVLFDNITEPDKQQYRPLLKTLTPREPIVYFAKASDTAQETVVTKIKLAIASEVPQKTSLFQIFLSGIRGEIAKAIFIEMLVASIMRHIAPIIGGILGTGVIAVLLFIGVVKPPSTPSPTATNTPVLPNTTTLPDSTSLPVVLLADTSTPTVTPTSTFTPIPTASPTLTFTPTNTPPPTASSTPTYTPSPSVSPTDAPIPTVSPIPSVPSTAISTTTTPPTLTIAPTHTPSPTTPPTDRPTLTVTSTYTVTPSDTPTLTFTLTHVPSSPVPPSNMPPATPTYTWMPIFTPITADASSDGFEYTDLITFGLYINCDVVEDTGCNSTVINNADNTLNKEPVRTVAWDSAEAFCHFIDAELPSKAELELIYNEGAITLLFREWIRDEQGMLRNRQYDIDQSGTPLYELITLNDQFLANISFRCVR